MSKHARMVREGSHKIASKRPREVALSLERDLQPLAPGAILQRAALAPESLRPVDLLRLQQTLGNRATGGLLTRPSGQCPILQAKLTVNAPGDEYEREADRVAEQVMRMPTVQREEMEEEEEPRVMAMPDIQRRAGGPFEAGEEFEQRLRAHRGQGQPLPSTLREEFETKFGADFGGLRIHTDSQSAEMNRAIQARAFTHGQDIYLGAGQYCLGRDGGKRLLAHELTHVVQQNGGLKQQHRPLGGPVPENSAQLKHTLEALRERHDLEGSGGEGQRISDPVQSALVPGSENVAERQHVAFQNQNHSSIGPQIQRTPDTAAAALKTKKVKDVKVIHLTPGFLNQHKITIDNKEEVQRLLSGLWAAERAAQQEKEVKRNNPPPPPKFSVQAPAAQPGPPLASLLAVKVADFRQRNKQWYGPPLPAASQSVKVANPAPNPASLTQQLTEKINERKWNQAKAALDTLAPALQTSINTEIFKSKEGKHHYLATLGAAPEHRPALLRATEGAFHIEILQHVAKKDVAAIAAKLAEAESYTYPQWQRDTNKLNRWLFEAEASEKDWSPGTFTKGVTNSLIYHYIKHVEDEAGYWGGSGFAKPTSLKEYTEWAKLILTQGSGYPYVKYGRGQVQCDAEGKILTAYIRR